jgi:hypothetical protein
MFSWQNATNKCAVINVGGYIVLNGVCEAIYEGRIFPCDKSSDVNLFAELSLNTNQPPATPSITGTSELALSLHADSGGWFPDGQILYQQLFRGFDFQYQTLLVPPGTSRNDRNGRSAQ